MKKRLGRGLEALLGDAIALDKQTVAIQLLPINKLIPGRYQPRQEMREEELLELADSIKNHGVIQPILVRENQKGHYEIVAGERRYRASIQAGLKELPAIVRDISDENALALGLIENIQREELNPIEEAQGFERLREEFGLTHEKIAQVIGRSRSSVTNSMRLLSLPKEIKDYLADYRLSAGHGRALLTLPLKGQLKLAKAAIAGGWSVRDIEHKIASLGKTKAAHKDQKKQACAQLAKDINHATGLRIKIREEQQGTFVLSMHLDSMTELQAVGVRLCEAFQLTQSIR